MSTTSTLSNQQILDLLKQLQQRSTTTLMNPVNNQSLINSSIIQQTILKSIYPDHQFNNNFINLTDDQLISRISSIIMNQSGSFDHNFDLFNHALNGDNNGSLSSGSSTSFDEQFLGIDNEDFIDNEQEIPLSLWIKIIFYVVYLIICLLGICGNLIVCYIVARKSTMHTVTNVFIANLALSDILLCLFAVPFTPLYLITFKNWIFGRALCHLVPFAQGVSVYISAFTLMSIAIDRYFVILHPFKPRMLMKICIMIIIAIWMSAIFLTFPYAHFMDYVETTKLDQRPSSSSSSSSSEEQLMELNDNGEIIDIKTIDNNNDDDDSGDGDGDGIVYLCAEQWPHEELSKMFGITTTALQFVIPFLIITFCYVKICAKLADRARTIPGNVSARREEQERERTRKTNGMLISMVVIFVISWLPLNMVNLLADFYDEASHWRNQRAIFLISHAIAMSSTCYNPFLYAWLNENFRKEFKEVLPCFGRSTKTNHSSNIVGAGSGGGGVGGGTLVELRQNNQTNNDNDQTDNTQQAINVNNSLNCPSVILAMNENHQNHHSHSNQSINSSSKKLVMKLYSKDDGSNTHCKISINHNQTTGNYHHHHHHHGIIDSINNNNDEEEEARL
ncbi:prolactin-releasing peptide receptor isoform X2 [Dermatophagoides farinae]|uniref:prolactin-releasing peptide receptor isoform X2 n=1 Tax=Dermatophagoides farinae TaxID=6954 RepID=UPI001F0E9954|nr:prolactin-releasing peptide receptor-like isoform X2 [Dermatophagoides farinae]